MLASSGNADPEERTWKAQAIRLLVRDELNDDERQAGSWGLPGLSGDTYEVQLPAR